jgi:hypothetical protein
MRWKKFISILNLARFRSSRPRWIGKKSGTSTKKPNGVDVLAPVLFSAWLSSRSGFYGFDFKKRVQGAETDYSGEKGDRTNNDESNPQAARNGSGEGEGEQSDAQDDADDPIQTRLICFHFKAPSVLNH